MFCIATYPLMTFLVSKLQSFVVNAWICFVKVMGTHALQIQSFDIKALKLWLCQSQIPFTAVNMQGIVTDSMSNRGMGERKAKVFQAINHVDHMTFQISIVIVICYFMEQCFHLCLLFIVHYSCNESGA